MSNLDLQRVLEQAITDGVTPSAQAVVIHHGTRAFAGAAGAASMSTAFDLASLTKVMSTTAAFMALWGEGKVGPDAPVSRFFPESPAGKSGVRIADLLYHRSGLPAWLPYFARAMPAVPELFDPACPPRTRLEVRVEVIRAAAACGLRGEPGAAAVYSDVGFILLGEILAQVAGEPLDRVYASRVKARLGLTSDFRRLSSEFAPGPESPEFAPTGDTRPRPPAPGQENLWAPFPTHPSVLGQVDDDNAWVMDGVAGHSGLFGTAEDVARFGQAIVEELKGAGKLAHVRLWQRVVARDSQTPDSTRALGFDTPSTVGSSAGALMASDAPEVIGHTGFTGTSLWIDLKRELVVSLLTNRTALGRANLGIRSFRPAFHDAVMRAFGEVA